MTKKIVSCLFALVLLLGCVFPAAALEIHIDNSQAWAGAWPCAICARTACGSRKAG